MMSSSPVFDDADEEDEDGADDKRIMWRTIIIM